MKVKKPNVNLVICSFIIMIVMSGCATRSVINQRMLLNGEESMAKKGDIFFSASPGNSIPEVKNGPFSLEILELNKKEIIFKYIDKESSIGAKGGAKKAVRTFTYPVNEKIIRFKEYEFQIIGAGETEIRYKRIK